MKDRDFTVLSRIRIAIEPVLDLDSMGWRVVIFAVTEDGQKMQCDLPGPIYHSLTLARRAQQRAAVMVEQSLKEMVE